MNVCNKVCVRMDKHEITVTLLFKLFVFVHLLQLELLATHLEISLVSLPTLPAVLIKVISLLLPIALAISFTS